MWSTPRTRSTALLRAWENRSDTAVVDEPLYAFYLDGSGAADPGRDDVLASRSADWRKIVDELVDAPVPDGKRVFYQKHMAQHVLPAVDRRRLAGLRHAFLIRHPAEMLASYAKVQAPTLDDLGVLQQRDLYRQFGGPVVDSGDLVREPEPVLRALCAELGVPFDADMLAWPAGPRSTDGVWGETWYENVRRSTGFVAPQPDAAPPALPPHLTGVLDRCLPVYEELYANRLRG